MASVIVIACGDGSDDSGTPSIEPSAVETAAKLRLPEGSGTDLDDGQRLAIADFNGDGFDDLAVGVPGSDPDGETRLDAGQIFVVSGQGIGSASAVSDGALLVISGAQAGDHLGFAVAAGDINADGVADLVASAIDSNGLENFRTDMGEVYAFFGGSSFEGERDLLDEQYDLLVQPAEGFSKLGTSLATGDVNADSIDDLVIGAPYAGRPPGSPVGSPRTTVGEVYALFGGPKIGGVVRVAEDDQDVLISGEREFDQFGASVAIADIDEDGIGDVLVGAPGYEGSPTASDGGGVFAFLGHPALAPRLATAEAEIAVAAAQAGGRLGDLVLGVESEGAEEARLIASSPTAGADDRPASGKVAVMTPPRGTSVAADVTVGTIVGADQGEFFPASMMTVVQDQLPRLACGSPLANAGSGAVFVVPATGNIDLSAASTDVRRIDGTNGERLGSAVVSGDLDGDGSADLAVLAAGQVGTAAPPGTVYIFR